MPVLAAINKHAKKTIDVHLMIVDPDRYIKTFAALGQNILVYIMKLALIYIEHFKQ
jgi:ribulose-phosphate 3-epimerase